MVRKGYAALVGAVAVERLAELAISRRNAAAMLLRGGREYGAGHFPAMVALHTGLLGGSLVEHVLGRRSFVPSIGWPAAGVTVAAQGLRWWCIASLGQQWNTRVIVSPEVPLVTRGPYRWLRHPNYVAVVIEGVALPLVGSAWITAAAFSVLNAAILRVRLRVENAALRDARTGGGAPLAATSPPGA